MNGSVVKRYGATLAAAALLVMGSFLAPSAHASASETSKPVEEKIETPTVDKLVGEVSVDGEVAWQKVADAQANVWVPYKVTGTLPTALDKFETYRYAFFDQLDPALDLDTSSVRVELLGKDGSSLADLTKGFAVTYADNRLTVSAANLKAIAPQAAGGCTVVLTYRARLIPGAATPGTAKPADNYVSLEFTKDPKTDELGRTPESRARLLTWELDVNKVAANNAGTHLEGARFTLKGVDGSYVGAQGQPVNEPYEFVTGKDGIAAIPCIDAGTYELTETSAPAGYAKLAAPIKIAITSELDQDGVRLGAASDSSSVAVSAVDTGAGTVRVDVSNSPATPWSFLPHTGDLVNLAAVGCIAVLGTFLIAAATRRKGDEGR